MTTHPQERLTPIHAVRGGLSVVPGLRTTSTACGLKASGDLDLGVLVADAPRNAAGVFTQNQAAAPPVRFCREVLAYERTCRVIVVNSGNANALTGQRGYEDAVAVVREAERLFGGPALPLSTGIIGVPLPRRAVLDGLHRCKDADDAEPDGFARAMLTTDTRTKEAARRVWLGDDTWAHVGGVAKGSGMIHPNMATMLGILATDAPIATPSLHSILQRVTEATFNRISVDGDTSTNDAVLALAGGLDLPELCNGDPRLDRIEEALRQVAADLAEQIVSDGEGATRVLRLRVHGARWSGDARAVARAVATSPLVKTALHGGDLNWGRVIATAGNAGVAFDVGELELSVGGAVIFSGGTPHPEALAAAACHFQTDAVHMDLRIGDGDEEVAVLTSDLSADYVAINAHYRT